MTAVAQTKHQVTLGGCAVDLMLFEDALSTIINHAQDAGAPLAVASINLDHVRHFGAGARWGSTLVSASGSMQWLNLLDGAPLRAQAARITGTDWPRLAGSDLINPILDAAERQDLSVGFLGGSAETHQLLKSEFAATRSGLRVNGWWHPARSVIEDPAQSQALADEVAAAGVDILVVGLGKPRQELWIQNYGQRTGAKVILAFGAVVDFLAGRVGRAPVWVSSAGLEWAWRLAQEPTRLAKRYLQDGPQAYVTLRRNSGPVTTITSSASANALEPYATSGIPTTRTVAPGLLAPSPLAEGTFETGDALVDVAVVIVTYNNASDIAPLVASLREQAGQNSLRIVVADNSPGPETLAELAKFPDVISLRSGGNLGYAGGINRALSRTGLARAVLILNPDLRLLPSAIKALRERMGSSGAGIVVPRLLDDDQVTYPSLRREPSVLRALGDALFGARYSDRPDFLAEIDFNQESYAYAHRIEWATGAALLISQTLVDECGAWDEQFFLYSEETDYFRRARELGSTVWFEPQSVMVHSQGGSGSSDGQTALLAVNRIRYFRKYHSPLISSAFRAAVVLSEVMRSYQPGHRLAARSVLKQTLWPDLPHAQTYPPTAEELESFPHGTVIIPAHNEESVIARTLTSLHDVAASGRVQIIIACNGCTDSTANIARGFDHVTVIEVSEASKVVALNAADALALHWPRVYLDADIEMSSAALREVLLSLDSGHLLAARPPFRYNFDGASWPVRAYYRARRRIPSLQNAMWGAGVYALAQAGHDRFGTFPDLTADDLFVDELYAAHEKAVVDTDPVIVRTPQNTISLLRVLQRVYRGQSQVHQGRAGEKQPSQTSSQRSWRTLLELIRQVRGPISAWDAVVYFVFAVVARRRHGAGTWERDESSRVYARPAENIGEQL